jgi:ubiquinone/menaquinone biosynthesis C-methylase UbiE
MQGDSINQESDHWSSVAGSWSKWDVWLDNCTAVYDDALLAAARITTGKSVLDLGSGTGHPAILIAQTISPSGRVMGLDISAEMLKAAEAKAARLGLGNIAFQKHDIGVLPFETAIFVAVTARFSLMFVRDLDLSLSEVHRVLKPGGYFAAAVWAPPNQNPLNVFEIREVMKAPAPDPSAPDPYRLSDTQEVMMLLRKAGFTDINADEVRGEEIFSSPEQFILRQKEMSVTFKNDFEKLSGNKQSEVEKILVARAEQFRDRDKIRIPRTALVFSCAK